MKKLAIGSDNFKSIIEGGYYYVDKTAYIKEILDNFIGTKLFLRPRRFGKTTNMLMLKEYFDITKKEENKDLFKGLYIDTLDEEYQKHKNAYPVIFMTLKTAKEGMKHIYDNEYYTKMQKMGIKEIWLYSIAFCQKKMLIKKEKLKM